MLPKKGIVFPKAEKLKWPPSARVFACRGDRRCRVRSIRREPLHFQGAKQSANLFDTRLEDRRISAVEQAGLSTLNEGQSIEYEIESNRGNIHCGKARGADLLAEERRSRVFIRNQQSQRHFHNF